MTNKRRGWYNESTRHSLARRGVKTYVAKGKKLKIGLPSFTIDKIKALNQVAKGDEWIAELIMLGGEIFIDDIQISDLQNKSYLRWNTGDDERDIGYIHYHPDGIIPEFSATDFILAMKIHDLRKQKKSYPYTVMGLVFSDSGRIYIRMYGIKPKKSRLEEFLKFENEMKTESGMKELLDKMTKTGELIKMEEVVL